MAENPYASDVDQNWYVAASPPTGLAGALKFLYGLCILVSVVGLASSLFEYQLLIAVKSGNPPSAEQIRDNDLQVLATFVIHTIVVLTTGITFLVWVYRSNRFLRDIGVDDLRFTPFWSIAWFLIPIANLWKPFQVVREILSRTRSLHTEPVGTDSILRWWWALMLLSHFVGRSASRYAMRAEDLDQMLRSSQLSLASDVVNIPYYIVVALLVSRISRIQQRTQSANSEGFSDRGGRIPLYGTDDAVDQSPSE